MPAPPVGFMPDSHGIVKQNYSLFADVQLIIILDPLEAFGISLGRFLMITSDQMDLAVEAIQESSQIISWLYAYSHIADMVNLVQRTNHGVPVLQYRRVHLMPVFERPIAVSDDPFMKGMRIAGK